MTTHMLDENFIRQLETASPHALPSLLMKCDLREKEDARTVIDRLRKEVYNNGSGMEAMKDMIMRSFVNSIYRAAVRGVTFKGNSMTTDASVADMNAKMKSIGAHRVDFYDEVIKFRYSPEFLKKYEIGQTDDPEVQPASSASAPSLNDIHAEADKHFAKNLDTMNEYHGKYIRERHENKTALDNYRKDYDTRTQKLGYRKDEELGGEISDSAQVNIDHVRPLAALFEGTDKDLREFSDFARRYGNGSLLQKDTLIKEVANEGNYAATDASFNKAKGAKTNNEVIERPSAKTADLTEKEKSSLQESDEKAKENIMKGFAQRGLVHGAKTVVSEQIGKLVATGIAGPLAYEMNDMFKCRKNKHKISILQRIKRIWAYLRSDLFVKLKNLLVDMLTDIGQMLTAFATTILSALIQSITNLLRKILSILVDGFHILVAAFRILADRSTSAAQKGDAILKLLVGCLTPLVAPLISAVVEPPLKSNPCIQFFFSLFPKWVFPLFLDTVSLILTSILSIVLLIGLDKLDLFGLKDAEYLRRLDEIFAERRRRLQARLLEFNVKVTEVLKQQAIRWQKTYTGIKNALDKKDYKAVFNGCADVAKTFNVDLPYSNDREFMEWLRSNNYKVTISA